MTNMAFQLPYQANTSECIVLNERDAANYAKHKPYVQMEPTDAPANRTYEATYHTLQVIKRRKHT